MDTHVYSEEEAQRILDAFPADKLNELLALAARAKEDERTISNHEKVILPEGWEYDMCGNCIIARYRDGEPERKEFYYPQIFIEFLLSDEIEARRSVEKRLALGYCSCGRPIPFVQRLLWANDLVEREGLSQLPARIVGYTVTLSLLLRARVQTAHQLSLMFNRHPDCL